MRILYLLVFGTITCLIAYGRRIQKPDHFPNQNNSLKRKNLQGETKNRPNLSRSSSKRISSLFDKLPKALDSVLTKFQPEDLKPPALIQKLGKTKVKNLVAKLPGNLNQLGLKYFGPEILTRLPSRDYFIEHDLDEHNKLTKHLEHINRMKSQSDSNLNQMDLELKQLKRLHDLEHHLQNKVPDEKPKTSLTETEQINHWQMEKLLGSNNNSMMHDIFSDAFDDFLKEYIENRRK